MKQKLFLFPGFGENASCFRNLKPFLRDFELVDIDYRPVLKNMAFWDTTPTNLCEGVISYYEIQPEDKLVGHSMGGYFSHVISILQANSTCLIGAFSDPNKIVRFSDSKMLNTIVTGSGLVKTPFMSQYIASKTKDARIRNEMLSIQKNFKSFSNKAMAQISILSFGEDLPPSAVQALRIHATNDRVVRTPDEKFEKVRGGHFSIIFHPDEVREKMDDWLND